jgi:hypothetical protein
VSKERIVQAVREGVSGQAAENIAGMKKQARPKRQRRRSPAKAGYLRRCAKGRIKLRLKRRNAREGRASGPLFYLQTQRV